MLVPIVNRIVISLNVKKVIKLFKLKKNKKISHQSIKVNEQNVFSYMFCKSQQPSGNNKRSSSNGLLKIKTYSHSLNICQAVTIGQI